MEKTRGVDKYKISFIVVLIVVLLSSCIFIGTVLAWLKDSDTFQSNGVITLGTVDFELYGSGASPITTIKNNYNGVTRTSIETPLTISGNSRDRSFSLSIRNTGTVSAIVRVTLQLYYLDSNGNRVVLIMTESDPETMSSNYVKMVSPLGKWTNDFKGGVTAGYMYCNSQIAPYTISSIVHNTGGTDTITPTAIPENAVTIVSQILVPESMKNQTYYISVTVDGVAYSGNIYQELEDKGNSQSYQIPVEAYPFGVPSGLPEAWTAWK